MKNLDTGVLLLHCLITHKKRNTTTNTSIKNGKQVNKNTTNNNV